jgi:hypothetical protein
MRDDVLGILDQLALDQVTMVGARWVEWSRIDRRITDRVGG